jgi:membrane associated rhomboid family serine protease
VSTVRTILLAAGSATVLALSSAPAAQAQTTTTTTTSSGVNWGVIAVVGIVFGVACALIANAKGRSPVLWGILGFLFGLIPLIIIAVLKKKQPTYTTGYGGPPGVPPPPPV